MFQCPHGLELLPASCHDINQDIAFQCPHGLELLPARIYNILNFSWYFLYIPAIYKCILAYFPIFFNQVSKFLRCESPSTFLGTCLSHHSFIILLITSTSALLTGLYLISTALNRCIFDTKQILCQCPLGLIPHFYGESLLHLQPFWKCVSMPSRAYTSFLRIILIALTMMVI